MIGKLKSLIERNDALRKMVEENDIAVKVVSDATDCCKMVKCQYKGRVKRLQNRETGP